MAVVLVVMECVYRAQGHLPSVTDDRTLWAHERARLYPDEGVAIALLGASRLQLGIVPSELAAALPGTLPVCLAVDGHSPFSLLEDLADDGAFDGVVVYCATPASMVDRELEEWTDFYRDEYCSAGSLDDRLNLQVRLYLQERLVLAGFWSNVRRQLGYGFHMPLDHVVTSRDRSRLGYYHERLSPAELERRRRGRLLAAGVAPPPPRFSPNRFGALILEELRPPVEAIRGHGGQVVFLHMPMPGRHLEMASYPRGSYWDRIGPLTGAPTIHFADYPELSVFQCPDGSHLDAPDARQFSRELARILKSVLASGVGGGTGTLPRNDI